VRLGLPPLAGGAVRLAKLVGASAAQGLLLGAQPMTPAQALKRGLIDEIVRREDLLDAARREKLERLAQATDALRDRFGFSKIQFGGSMTKFIAAPVRGID